MDVEVLGFGLAGVKTGLLPTDRETEDWRRGMNECSYLGSGVTMHEICFHNILLS